MTLKQVKMYKSGVAVGYGYIHKVGKRYLVGIGKDMKSLNKYGGAFFQTKKEALTWSKELNELQKPHKPLGFLQRDGTIYYNKR